MCEKDPREINPEDYSDRDLGIMFLKRANLIDDRIQKRVEQIERNREIAERVTSLLTGMPRGGSLNSREDVMVNLADLTEQMAKELAELGKVRLEILHELMYLEKPEEAKYLEDRYLYGMKGSQIAEKHLTSQSTVGRSTRKGEETIGRRIRERMERGEVAWMSSRNSEAEVQERTEVEINL